MRAIDTNVLARYLLNDDKKQSELAAATIAAGVFVPATVLLELSWLLQSRYRQSREVVADTLAGIIDLPSVTVADAPLMRWVLSRYAAGADIADMIHLASSTSTVGFATFDRAVVGDAGPGAPVPVETLD
ncbi:conserved hypothetical protein [Sphingomonas sp. EC-HK361]|uniref:type II toxin-antitoxin system VapC family toxin n=1 Tax=Sphingomonas sp. EC-HK361 TaxID=2038397 RepID=UPI0012529847|nr:type II toxin-antitoxin system VapC family toxin [Sphingomonas sp. EC-HK361]VVS98197.1 conserved hypothetical protein [Sphingomonas sp. EC-HK361]